MKKSIFLLLVFVNSLAAQYYYEVFDQNNGGVQYEIFSFYQESDSVYWLGGVSSDPWVYKFNGDSVVAIFQHPSTAGNTIFSHIQQDSTGKLWITGSGNGVFTFNEADTTWEHFTTQNTNMITDTHVFLEIDILGRIWTSQSIDTITGITKYDGTTWTSYGVTNSPLASNYVYPLAQDDKGRLYFGAMGYISSFNPATGIWNNNFNPTVCNGFSAFENFPEALFVTPNENNLISTAYGLVIWDSLANCLQNHLPYTNDVKSDGSPGLIQDSKGNIWISYYFNFDGISKYDGTNWEYFDLNGEEIYFIYEDKFSYKLWLTTWSNKLICFYPDSLVSISENNNLPQDFTLSQNYPNPFNPTTKISFNLPNGIKNASLTIFNVLGKEVKTWKPNNSGEVVWDGKDEKGNSTSSGTYFYQLKAGGLSQTKKMTLVK
ncbi:T9SS type A sorting domain-containing protein [bacterium]|nr:T9SS type A sorting domain-containing protein [bacterium]